MNANLKTILTLIENIPDDDFLELQRHLNERSERVWQHEAKLARSEAEKKGIDDSAIEAAIHRHGGR